MKYFTHHKCATNWVASISNYMKKYVNEDVDWNGNSCYQRHVSENDTGLHIIRDPRAMLLSAYNSHKYSHPVVNWPELVDHRKKLNAVDFETGLMLTMDFLQSTEWQWSDRHVENRPFPPFTQILTWDYKNNNNIRTVKMEEITTDPLPYLKPFFSESNENILIECIKIHSFTYLKRRTNNKHYINGNNNKWKEVLPSSVIQRCNRLFEFLIKEYYDEKT